MTSNRGTALHRAVRLVRFGLVAVGALVLLVSFTPIVRWSAAAMAGGWHPPEGEVLVVLSADADAGGIIAANTYLRTMYAVRADRRYSYRTIVVSGGGTPPVALSMREFLVSAGVPAAAIVAETASRSTRESAVNLAPVLRSMPGRKVLMTSDYHMFRATRTFRNAGVDLAPAPIPDAFKNGGSIAGRWPAFITMVGEIGKIAYYGVRGWL